MGTEKCMMVVQDFFRRLVGEPWRVVAVVRGQEGWSVKIEVVEEDEYMRRHGRDALFAIYDVDVNESFEVVSYRRVGFRRRGDLPEEEEA